MKPSPWSSPPRHESRAEGHYDLRERMRGEISTGNHDASPPRLLDLKALAPSTIDMSDSSTSVIPDDSISISRQDERAAHIVARRPKLSHGCVVIIAGRPFLLRTSFSAATIVKTNMVANGAMEKASMPCE